MAYIVFGSPDFKSTQGGQRGRTMQGGRHEGGGSGQQMVEGREQEVAARRHSRERAGGGGQAALTGERGRGMRDVRCCLVLMLGVGFRVKWTLGWLQGLWADWVDRREASRPTNACKSTQIYKSSASRAACSESRVGLPSRWPTGRLVIDLKSGEINNTF
jgi:hypothetical protein